MLDILQHFEQEESGLRERIEANPTPENTMRIVRDYLTKLHHDFSKTVGMHKSRQLNYMLDSLQFAFETAYTVEATGRAVPLAQKPSQPTVVSGWWITGGKIIQAIVLMIALCVIVNIARLWILLLLCILVFLIEKYVQMLEHGRRKPNRFFSRLLFPFKFLLPQDLLKQTQSPDSSQSSVRFQLQPQVEVQKTVKTQVFLNYLTDALACVHKFLNESEEAGEEAEQDNFLQKESQLLEFFQDMLEAQYDNDGKWALKKVSGITAILARHGIVVKNYDPNQPEDEKHFEFDPSDDSDYRTIRPALIKGEDTLRQGLVNKPK